MAISRSEPPTPYGVRSNRNGSGSVALRGLKISTCSFSPSRIGMSADV
jgi:hypothetical protein